MFLLTGLIDSGQPLLCIWELVEEKAVLQYFYYTKPESTLIELDEDFKRRVILAQGLIKVGSAPVKNIGHYPVFTDPVVYNMSDRTTNSIHRSPPAIDPSLITPYIINASEDYGEMLGLLTMEALEDSSFGE